MHRFAHSPPVVTVGACDDVDSKMSNGGRYVQMIWVAIHLGAESPEVEGLVA